VTADGPQVSNGRIPDDQRATPFSETGYGPAATAPAANDWDRWGAAVPDRGLNGYGTARPHTSNSLGTNGDATHSQATNGQATYGQATYGQATNGQATNGQATNGQTTNGYATHGQATNGYATHGQATNGYRAGGYGTPAVDDAASDPRAASGLTPSRSWTYDPDTGWTPVQERGGPATAAPAAPESWGSPRPGYETVDRSEGRRPEYGYSAYAAFTDPWSTSSAPSGHPGAEADHGSAPSGPSYGHAPRNPTATDGPWHHVATGDPRNHAAPGDGEVSRFDALLAASEERARREREAGMHRESGQHDRDGRRHRSAPGTRPAFPGVDPTPPAAQTDQGRHRRPE
jgi:hypothetical protein